MHLLNALNVFTDQVRMVYGFLIASGMLMVWFTNPECDDELSLGESCIVYAAKGMLAAGGALAVMDLAMLLYYFAILMSL